MQVCAAAYLNLLHGIVTGFALIGVRVRQAIVDMHQIWTHLIHSVNWRKVYRFCVISRVPDCLTAENARIHSPSRTVASM